MRKSIRGVSSRGLLMVAVMMVVLAVHGDRGVRATAAAWEGIDPLEVLTQQVKNNVLFIIDTSGSMKWPVGVDYTTVGDDDPMSRAYVAKKAVRTVVRQHTTDINMGIATYDVLPTQKAINRNQDFTGGPANGGDSIGSNDGPFIYVTNDPNAAVFYGSTGACKDTSTNINGSGSSAPSNEGFFCAMNDTFTNYTTTGTPTAAQIATAAFRRFGNFGAMATPFVDPNCTTNCNRYYMQSHLFYSGVSFSWDRSKTLSTAGFFAGPTAGVACGTPPAGLTGDWNDDNTTDPVVPCMVFHDVGSNKDIKFWYTSTVFQINVPAWKAGVTYNPGDIVDVGGNNSYLCTATNVAATANQPGTTGGNAFWTFNTGGINCAGAAVLSVVPVCTADNSQTVLDTMRPALPIKDVSHLGNDSSIVGNTVKDYMNTTTPTNVDTATGGWGLRFDQGTPLKSSLDDVFNANPQAFPAQANPNQKNFVILLTDGDDTCADNNVNTAADLASQSAHALFINTADFRHQAETFVITLGSNATRAGKIAVAGSGGPINTATCPTGGAAVVGCTNAFPANSVTELVNALNAALSIAATSGTFLGSEAIVGTVFEQMSSPTSPGTARYPGPAENMLYQSRFDLPDFRGHLRAFKNVSSGYKVPLQSSQAYPPLAGVSGEWDAANVLNTLILNGSMQLTGGVTHAATTGFTFAELHGGNTVDNLPPITSTTSAPAIKRRIFTSNGNGSFLRTTSGTANWDSSTASGRNVVALWPPNQSGLTATPALSAGVDPAVGTNGDFDIALGLTSTKTDALFFLDLQSQLGACDNSSSSPASSLPANCTSATDSVKLGQARKEAREILLAWIAGAQLARGADGKPLRNNGTNDELVYIARPFILLDSERAAAAVVSPPFRGERRPPQVHTTEWSLLTEGSNASSDIDQGFGQFLKTQGPTSPLQPRMTIVYVGANDGVHAFNAGNAAELWSFIPFDQLGKIYTLASTGQTVANHTYMVASSIRVAEVFMPTSSYTVNGTSYSGHWRTMLIFGRGAGGRFYTALDVNAPGPFTRDPLRTNPPWVLWNRGNTDTANTAYANMGETWSVPALGNVDASLGLPEWRAFTGSGYVDPASGPVAAGKTFYELNAITGDIVRSVNAADGTSTIPNALVANPAGFNASELDRPSKPTTAADITTRLYIPDLHGRVWKYLPYNTGTAGTTGTLGLFADGTNNGNLTPGLQPFGASVALVNQVSGGNRNLVFAESGYDNRIADTNTFYMFGWTDTTLNAQGLGTLENASVTPPSVFPLAFLDENSHKYRGIAQPATALTPDDQARVFFLGRRFVPISNLTCASSFDSILFAMGAVTGAAVYNFGSGTSRHQPVVVGDPGPPAISVAGGVVVNPDSKGNTNGGGSAAVAPPSTVISRTRVTAERLGSTVCAW